MKRELILEAIETKINGNHSNFKAFVKKASKTDVLDAIEIAQGEFGIQRHLFINDMRNILEA